MAGSRSAIMMRPDTQDELVVSEVLGANQYQLPDSVSGTVVDIGANIGAFALACLERGADRVICFEPDEGCFEVLKTNLTGYRDRTALINAPVWRSDVNENVGWNSAGSNTACGSVEPRGGDRQTIGLESILEKYGPISLLKIDAEGSEYPILYTCRRFGEIGAIIGESHRLFWVPGKRLCGIPEEFFCIEGLAVFLRRHGFQVTWKRESEKNDVNHLFWADRDMVKFGE